jgi:quinolinate synthase
MKSFVSGPSRTQAEQRARLHDLKAERNAVLVAHNYQPDEVQAEADYTGDSLELARLASRTTAEVIVFAGVRFMAESAKLLSPEKTVLLPDLGAGCMLADTVTPEAILAARAEHPQAAVVVYINSPVEVKAQADICCTSANAVQVVNSLPHEEILFYPDRNLAAWVARHTTKRIWPGQGFCGPHQALTRAQLTAARRAYPQARVLVHPECPLEVCLAADAVLSTAGMLRYAKTENAQTFIIGTEIGLLYRLRLENPTKTFIPLSPTTVCASMKRTSLDSVITVLETLQPAIRLDETVRVRAAQALKAMFRLS